MIEEKNMSKIIKRMLYWVDWYESKSTDTRKDDVGIFADFNKDTFECKNTGIYRKDNMDLNPTDCRTRFRIYCEGFYWNGDNLRLEMIKKLKEYTIKMRKDQLNEDFE